MQTRTKKTLTTAALGLAVTAAAAGTASAAGLAQGSDTLAPLGSAANLVPGAASSVSGAQTALSNGAAALPANPSKVLPSGNHLSGNRIAPVTGLLGGLPAGGSVLGG
jgi:hypothetical protein